MLKEQALDVAKRIEVEAPDLGASIKQDQLYHEEWYIELSGFRKTPNPVYVKNIGDWELYKEFMRMQVIY